MSSVCIPQKANGNLHRPQDDLILIAVEFLEKSGSRRPGRVVIFKLDGVGINLTAHDAVAHVKTFAHSFCQVRGKPYRLSKSSIGKISNGMSITPL